jgi:hypothetical protein
MSVIDDVVSGLSHIKRLWMTEGRAKWPARVGAGCIVLVLLIVVGGVVSASLMTIGSAWASWKNGRVPAEPIAPSDTPAAHVAPGGVYISRINAIGPPDAGPMIFGPNVHFVQSSVIAPHGVIQNGGQNYNAYIQGDPVIQNGVQNIGGIVRSDIPAAVTHDGGDR